MKCVGAEDGTQPCQRCRRTGVEYVIFNAIRSVPSYSLTHSLTLTGVCSRDTDEVGNRAQSSFRFGPQFGFSFLYIGYPKLQKC